MKKIKLIELLGEEWADVLAPEFEKPYMKRIQTGLTIARAKKIIYPSSDAVFRAFKLTPLSKVKCVFLGPGPFSNKNDNGLAFSSSDENPYLEEIMKIHHKCYPTTFNPKIMDGDLSPWAEEGVLLLNMSLTVPEGEPGKHLKHWSPFIDKVIEILDSHISAKVFVLVGDLAKKYILELKSSSSIPYAVEHPSVAIKENRGWRAENLFHKVNNMLRFNHVTPIDWDKA